MAHLVGEIDMRRENIVCAIIVSLIIICILAGCYPENFISSDVEGEKMAKELLDYLSEDDADGLKSMFCDRAKESPDLDRQIEEALIFFEGAVISEDPHILVSSGAAMDRGRMTWIDISASIDGIRTDENKTFDIGFNAYLLCVKEKDIVGISVVYITNKNGEIYTIGEYIEKASVRDD